MFCVQHRAEKNHAFFHRADGFRQQRARRVRVAAALKLLGDAARGSVPAAEARKDGVAPPEQGHEHRVFRRAAFKQLMHDGIGVAHDVVHEADGG